MSVLCKNLRYDGNESHKWLCTDTPYCDIPDTDSAGACVCAFGYKNLTNGSCVLACPNTTHNGDPNVCSAIPHCEKPTTGLNCTCASGYTMNRYGECDGLCTNTIYQGGNECTRKIGCINPGG